MIKSKYSSLWQKRHLLPIIQYFFHSVNTIGAIAQQKSISNISIEKALDIKIQSICEDHFF